MKYPRIYHMLVVHGHSPTHARDIIVDAQRGQAFAKKWIVRAHSMVPFQQWVERRKKFADPIFRLKKVGGH